MNWINSNQRLPDIDTSDFPKEYVVKYLLDDPHSGCFVNYFTAQAMRDEMEGSDFEWLDETPCQEIEKLQSFKNYVHKRLDDAGIEKEPNGLHSKDCRIGDRLDIVEKIISDTYLEVETLQQINDVQQQALKKIANWELPATGKFWDTALTQPTSYETEFGSNGVRDFIKTIAESALSKSLLTQKHPLRIAGFLVAGKFFTEQNFRGLTIDKLHDVKTLYY